MRNIRLSKYGFRLTLSATLKVTSLCGLIYYVLLCLIGISLLVIPHFLVKYFNSKVQFPKIFEEQHIREIPGFQDIYRSQWHGLRDGFSILVEAYLGLFKDIMMSVGAVLTIWSFAWFGFFYVLRRKVKKEDLFGIRNLLAKSTFIRGGIFNGVNFLLIILMIRLLSIKIGGAYCCMILLLSVIMVIFNSTMMRGVYDRKAKPVEVFIIFSHISFILSSLVLLIGPAIVSLNLQQPWFILAGFILFLISLVIYTFNIFVILCLHSIILSSSTEMNNLPIISRADMQIIQMTNLGQ